MSERKTQMVDGRVVSEQSETESEDVDVFVIDTVGNFDDVNELVVGERTCKRSGRGATKKLVHVDTGEVVIGEEKHSFGALNIGGNIFLTSSYGATDELYTLEGEKIRQLPTLDFKELTTITVGGREFYALTRSGFERTCLVEPETGEFLTEFHDELVVDGCTVKGYRTLLGEPEEVVEVEPDPVWELEQELEEDEQVEAPAVTDEVEAVCDDYVEHNDFEWVLDLEAELEDALT